MYESIDDLPETIRDVLPEAAQEVYLQAYNEAWQNYDEEETSEMPRDAVAHRKGWNAMRREYVKDDVTGKWYPPGEVPEREGSHEEEGLLEEVTDVV